MSTETIEQTFEVGSPAQLKVGNVRGTVDIRLGDEGVIAVTAVKHGSSNGTQIIIEQLDDGKVVVEAKQENSVMSWFGMNKPNKVDFTIRVPKSCALKLNCVSCDAAVEGLEGEIDVNTVSGDLKLNNLSGAFNFSAVSGEIQAQRISGSLALNTVSGDVQIAESQISSLEGKTVSGDMHFQTSLAAGPYVFKTVSGNVTLLPPEDQGCVVNIKSVSGEINTSLPVSQQYGHGPNRSLTILTGGPEISLKSVSGDIHIGEKAEALPKVEVETARPVKPIKPAEPVKSQMQILEEIENGELSVEDALKMMNPR
ncbi:MAG TPA: hypothetical protein DEH25_16755 [Chloroflexi bacterium]|nr:hypothetical protein [Chloroflexota bacterium]HBY07268.1 hypothetical protein [Chloroflexota bacterium]